MSASIYEQAVELIFNLFKTYIALRDYLYSIYSSPVEIKWDICGYIIQ